MDAKEEGWRNRFLLTLFNRARNEDECKVGAALEKVAAEVGAKSIQAGSFSLSSFFSFTSRHVQCAFSMAYHLRETLKSFQYWVILSTMIV